MIDLIVLGLVAVAVVFGLIRGVISQIMGIAGLVAAYFLAPPGGRAIAGAVAHQLGSSKFMAEKASIFFVGLAVYIGCRLIGFAAEKLFVNRVKEFKSLNRIGGAVLGGAKAAAILAVLFCFLALIPQSEVRSWFPKVLGSWSYRLAARYNPMGKQTVLDGMRHLRTSMSDPKAIEWLKGSDEIEKILSRYELKGVLNDQEFVRSLHEGDYGALSRNEQIEALMKDAELTQLLEKLEKEPPG